MIFRTWETLANLFHTPKRMGWEGLGYPESVEAGAGGQLKVFKGHPRRVGTYHN